MEDAVTKIGELCPVNIPVQMMSVTDRDGKVTPLWFRFETREHSIEKVIIEKTISRDECHYMGIRDKKFVCSAVIDGVRRILEIRYHVENQRWRIFQFLA